MTSLFKTQNIFLHVDRFTKSYPPFLTFIGMNLAFLFKGKSFVGMSPRPCGARALKDIVTSERQLLKKSIYKQK